MKRSTGAAGDDLHANVAAVVINYQTPDLLETAVRSFHRFYPEVPLLVVDNGSQDGSPELIRQLQRDLGRSVEGLLLEQNIYHGPAMHLAIQRLNTPYVYVFDSDTETRRGGFLEGMLAELSTSEKTYGAGRVVTVNRRGFAAPKGIPVLQSAYMLLKRPVYLELPAFLHHGLPALANFRAAAERGYRLASYPVEDYVAHFGRGTAARFGYGLGLRGRIDFLLNKLGL